MRRYSNSTRTVRLGLVLCIFLIVASIPVSSAPVEIEDGILTNMEILERISSEAIEELISNVPLLSRDKLVLVKKAKGVGNIDFVFENMLIKHMDSSGFGVYVETPKDTLSPARGPNYRFSYQIIKFVFSYPKIKRRYWLGAREVERVAEIGIFAQLIDLSSGNIVWVGDTQKKFGDVISYDLLGAVEDEAHEFTRPPRRELNWSRLVEPIVVTGIVAGLVYLFFSNQSGE